MIEQVNISEIEILSQTKLNVIIFGVIAIALILVINFFIDVYLERPKNTIRKRQSLKGLRESAIKKEIESLILEKSKVKRQYEIEKMCAQAGLNFSYGEYMILCLICAILLPIFIIITMGNLSLAFVCIGLGMLIPGQIISFIKNRRIIKLEQQLSSMMELLSENYKTTRNIDKSLENVLLDFEGVEPIQYEIRRTLLDVHLGTPTVTALESMASRTGNIYFNRMIDYLKIAEDIGSDDVRKTLMEKALTQSRKNLTRRNSLRSRIAGPKNTSYILLSAVPGVMIYQAMTTDDYVDFMLNTQVGQIGLTVIFSVMIGCIWFINKKIGAPIE